MIYLLVKPRLAGIATLELIKMSCCDMELSQPCAAKEITDTVNVIYKRDSYQILGAFDINTTSDLMDVLESMRKHWNNSFQKDWVEKQMSKMKPTSPF